MNAAKPAKTEVAKAPVAEVKKEETTTTPTATTETKVEEKKEKKTDKPKITKKDFAEARGVSMWASKKHCMYIGNYIKGKPIDQSIKELEEVTRLKRVIPMKGEIPHRKGPGMMSGRYPVKTAGLFIALLKGLKGNVIVNGMDLDNTRIFSVVSNWASRPQRKKGVKFKRTHVVIIAKELSNMGQNNKKQKGAKK